MKGHDNDTNLNEKRPADEQTALSIALPSLDSGSATVTPVLVKKPQLFHAGTSTTAAPATELLPSFAQSEFETIIRRQRPIPSHGLKIAHAHHPRNAPQLDADWQFAGWGSVSYLELTSKEVDEACDRITKSPTAALGQLRGTSMAGNGVFGSVFYAFPAVAASSSIFSPLSLLIASLLLFLFHPLLLELGRSARMNGANYTYLLQFSGKAMGILGAAVTLFDALATSVVSSATASAYLSGEFSHLPIKQFLLAICLLLTLTAVAFISMRESTGLALAFTTIHLMAMAILMVAALVMWIRHGSHVLAENWASRPSGSSHIASAIFNGVCIGFLSTTGFECTPAYIEEIRPRSYSSVLRNLLVGALMLNAPLMLLVYAILPNSEILSGANVLSILAERVGGRWLRIIIVVDAMLVLAGGVLTGLFTVCGLLERLARDRVLPPVFLRKLSITNAPYASLASFVALSIALYASCGFSLSTASSLFSLSFLSVMGLYAVSSLLLRFQRNRLPRGTHVSLWFPVLSLITIVVVLIGNIVPRPKTFGLFIAYMCGVALCLSARSYELDILKVLMNIYNQAHILHRFSLDKVLIKRIKKLQCVPVYVWVNTDDIHLLLEACLYVQRNESTSRMVLIHAYDSLENIPSELEANSKILDEAFPAMTIDLVFLKGQFSPSLTEAVSAKLDVPLSSCFMFCPGESKKWDLANYRGIRVIR